MQTSDILRKKPAFRTGYEPVSVAISTLDVKDLGIYRKFKTIPSKITAYFHREKIKEVFKTTFESIDDDYYLILSIDGTIFHIEY